MLAVGFKIGSFLPRCLEQNVRSILFSAFLAGEPKRKNVCEFRCPEGKRKRFIFANLPVTKFTTSTSTHFPLQSQLPAEKSGNTQRIWRYMAIVKQPKTAYRIEFYDSKWVLKQIKNKLWLQTNSHHQDASQTCLWQCARRCRLHFAFRNFSCTMNVFLFLF